MSTAPEALKPIGMQDVRLVAGEGKLDASTVLQAVNVILKQRAERASRTPAPGVERADVARVIYEFAPFYEAGESLDGFTISPGGNLSWDQAKDRDAEFGDDPLFRPILGEAYAVADAILCLINGEQRGS